MTLKKTINAGNQTISYVCIHLHNQQRIEIDQKINQITAAEMMDWVTLLTLSLY